MICHEYKCLFIHVPKTGGQSIESFFLSQLGLSWQERAALLLKRNYDPKLGPTRLAHLKAYEYFEHNHIKRENYNKYFKFAFIRNPWERIVSEYKYRGYSQRFDFKTYLFEKLPKPEWSDPYIHIEPQVDFLYAKDGTCLVDFIGRFENLQQDFNKVCQHLGINDSELPYRNKSDETKNTSRRSLLSFVHWRNQWRQHKNNFDHYTKYYDDESHEFVQHLYRKDIDQFGYEFGL